MRLFDLIKRPKRSASTAQLPVMRELPATTEAPQDAAQSPETPLAPSPDEVRDLVFCAIASGDETRVAELCEEHREVIAEHGSAWVRPPIELHANPAAIDWYTRGLSRILN